MTRLFSAFAAALCVGCVLSVSALAQTAPAGGVVKLPQDVEFKGLPGAPQYAVLFGDPKAAGMFIQRVKFPKGTKIMPHWHPEETRTVTVLSGTFYFGLGEQFDESKLKQYPAGTMYSEAARTPHFAWARDEEVILQISAIGPSGNTPIPQK